MPGKNGEEVEKTLPMIFIIVLIILSLDQFTKFIFNRNLTAGISLPVMKNIFYLTLVHNRGAAFGILKNQTYLFIFTSIFAIILIYFGLKEQRRKRLSVYVLSLALILAGAIGNLIDRLSFGYVIDFLDLRIWPVFNIADAAITIGAVLLGWSVLREKRLKS
ncbi:MAG: signal peptidase II [Candidatus Omnitrophota bacterium]|nr:signal peptidase II [Candidatus Omnitrophota bacterium]